MGDQMPPNHYSCELPFLIIAGATKAGTTSLFKYLADHPDVAPCATKDPFFFLPLEFPRNSTLRYERDSVADYLALFSDSSDEKVRLEASPLYLQSVGAGKRIKQALPNVRVLASLRDPISRLHSYYQMAVLFGWLPSNLSFDDYVDKSFIAKDAEEGVPFYKYPIDEGLYAERVSRYLSLFGSENFTTIWFDDLQSRTRDTLKEVAAFANIDPSFYEDYQFKNVNPAKASTFPKALVAYHHFRKNIRQSMSGARYVNVLLRKIKRQLEPLILNMLVSSPDTAQISTKTRGRLTEFYRADVHELANVLNEAPPWMHQYK